MHSGGIADKVGNRYEARWVTHQVLGLLDGSVRAITIEGLGAGHQAFEFALERETGTEWHQCKRQTTVGSWTIANLAAAGVFSAFHSKIGNGDRCVFVSTEPTPQIKSLQDKRPATHDPAGFVASLSEKETQSWVLLRDRFGSDTDAFRFLGSTEFRTLSETDLDEFLHARLSYWFRGNPEGLAARLRTWVEDDQNFNRPIVLDDLLAFIGSSKIELKQHQLDQTLPGRIKDATTSYLRSYPEIGANLFRIDRQVATEVVQALNGGAKVVFLTGVAGAGKSAVLHDVIANFRAEARLHLAFRVDQAGSVATLDQLGKQMVGTDDNPAVILEQLAVGKQAVLIIDQADAVSEASGRVAELRRVVLDLIRKAAEYRHVQIVLACRSFDLENDHAFQQIADSPTSHRIEVPSLALSDIEPVLHRLGILVDRNNARLMALLSLPIGLSLAAALSKSGITDLRTVEHISGLYRRLLEERDKELQRDLKPGWSIYAPLGALATSMSERQQLVAPVSVLDAFGGAAPALQRLGLIVVRGERVGFLHESLFDYIHARAFVQQRQPLIQFLLSGEQTLFRRTQSRQILAFQRELEPSLYRADLEAILFDSRVRLHIRETIVRWLGAISDPTDFEWGLIERYAEADSLPRKAGSVIYGRKPWFDLLVRRGVVDAWLNYDGPDLQWVLGFVRSVADSAPDETAALISAFVAKRPDKTQNILTCFRWLEPKAESRPLANCLIAALEQTTPEHWESEDSDWGDFYAPWIKRAPREAARIFAGQLGRWFRLNSEGHPFGRRYEDGGTSIHWIGELAKADPVAFLAALLPYMRLAMERTVRGDELPSEDSIWYWRHWDRTDFKVPDLMDIVRGALSEAGKIAPDIIADLLRGMQPERFITSLHLLLEAIPSNPEALTRLLIEQCDNPGLFRAGWSGAEGHSAANAIAAAMPFLGPTDRNRIEDLISSLRPELDLAIRYVKHERSEEGMADAGDIIGSRPRVRQRRLPPWVLGQSGMREWSVLRQIGADKLSPRSAKRLRELERKFVGQKPEEPDGIRGGMVRSPIHADRTKFMNDQAWLQAMVKISRQSDHRRWGDDGLRGGPGELATVLKERAKEQPQRFLSLLGCIPEGASSDFAHGIVTGLTEAKPTTDVVEKVLSTIARHPPAQPDDRTVIWLIRACQGPIGPQAEATLLRVALSSNDSTGIGEINRNGRNVEADWRQATTQGHDLLGKAINSARGSALYEIGERCWEAAELFDRYRDHVDKVVGGDAAAHIHASLDMAILAALKHDPETGVNWALRTAQRCPQALFGQRGHQAIHWVGDHDPGAFRQILDRYIRSQEPVARAFGGVVLAQRSLQDPDWAPLVEQAMATDSQLRAATAAAAAASLRTTRFGTLCSDWLMRFFEDEDAMVRREASDCFRLMGSEEVGRFAPLFEAYSTSPHFEADRSYFLHRLENAPPSFDKLVLKLIGDALGATATDTSNDRTSHELYRFGELALKLYAGSVDDDDRRTQCLNVIDHLVQRGLMDIQKLEQA